MRAVQAGDGADQLAGLRIDHIDARAVGEIQAVSLPVGGQIIPSAIAADLPLINDLVRLLRGGEDRKGQQAAEQKRGRGGQSKKAKRALHGHGKAPGTTRQEYHRWKAAV